MYTLNSNKHSLSVTELQFEEIVDTTISGVTNLDITW